MHHFGVVYGKESSDVKNGEYKKEPKGVGRTINSFCYQEHCSRTPTKRAIDIDYCGNG